MHCITNGPGMIHLTSAMQRTFCGPRLANIPDLFCGQCNASTMGIRNSQSGINLTNRSDDTSAPWGVAAPHGAFGCRRLPVITVSRRLASRSSVSSPAVLVQGVIRNSQSAIKTVNRSDDTKRPMGRLQMPHGAFAFFLLPGGPDEKFNANSFLTTQSLAELAGYIFSSWCFVFSSRKSEILLNSFLLSMFALHFLDYFGLSWIVLVKSPNSWIGSVLCTAKTTL